MIDRNSDPTGWDYLADLMSGRIHKELESLTLNNTDQDRRIEMATVNEQRLLDAATKINDTAESLRGVVEAMKAKVDTLTAQAQAPTATPTPENLDDEFATLEQAMANLASVGSVVETAAPEAGSGSGSGEAPSIAGEPISGAPVETPLAGASGTTNPPAEGEGPLTSQPAPGTDPTSPQVPVEGGSEGTTPNPVDEPAGEGLAEGIDGTENTSVVPEGGADAPEPSPNTGDESTW